MSRACLCVKVHACVLHVHVDPEQVELEGEE